MKKGFERQGGARLLLLTASGLLCLGASSPRGVAVEPFFAEDYEQRQVERRQYSQQYHEGIKITGTPDYLSRVAAALERIEERDSRSWYFVRKHIRKITLNGHPGIDVGGGRLTSGPMRDESVEAIAGGIVHEAWHRELYFRGSPWSGREAEAFCLEKQGDFLERVGAAPLDAEEALLSEYWRIDYWSRDW